MFVKSMSRHLCKSCAKAKITRRSFNPTDPDTQLASLFLAKVTTADIAVYLNCPLRQGYKYGFVITDVATKMLWEFPFRLGVVKKR